MKLFSACVSLALLCGCVSQNDHKLPRLFEPFTCDGPVLVLCGCLQTNWFEFQLGVAQYKMQTMSVAIIFDAVYYRATLPAVLPTNALLAIVRRDDGVFELLGRDASKSIAEDTPENRNRWKTMYSKGEFLPPRRAWLSESAAISLAQKALEINNEHRRSFNFKARRYELGWSIWVDRKGDMVRFGDYTTVVVGDDGKIKAIMHGL